jgi:hypothetical protein
VDTALRHSTWFANSDEKETAKIQHYQEIKISKKKFLYAIFES